MNRTVVAFIALFLIGCSKRYINADLGRSSKAAMLVSQKMNLKVERIEDADREQIKILNPSGEKIGLVELFRREPTKTEVKIESKSVDEMPPALFSSFYLASIDYQLNLESGGEGPHQNKEKSMAKFHTMNIVFPTVGAYYALKGNPFFYNRAVRTTILSLQGLNDAATVAFTVAYFRTDDENTKALLFPGLLASLLIPRLFGLNLGQRVIYYNKVCKVDFDLSQLRMAF